MERIDCPECGLSLPIPEEVRDEAFVYRVEHKPDDHALVITGG